MIPAGADKSHIIQPGNGLLRAEHFPLRGVFLTAERARRESQPRWQLVPAAPVATPRGPSNLLTEFGWIAGRFGHIALEDENSAILGEILEEFDTEIPAHTMPVYYGTDRALVPFRFGPAVESGLCRRPAILGMPFPLALAYRLTTRQVDRKLPFNMNAEGRRAFARALQLVQHVGSALVDAGPLSADAPLSLCLTPNANGPCSIQILSHRPQGPSSQMSAGALHMHQTAGSLSDLTAQATALVPLIDAITQILGGLQAPAVMLLGEAEPTGHRKLEAATILEAWRKGEPLP